MKNYAKTLGKANQHSAILGRNDMVENNAGGYVFEVTPQQRLERFLLIGSEGGTYYVNEQKLTEENAKTIVKMIQGDGLRVVETVVDFAVNSRAPKADAGIFVLALCATHGNDVVKKAAYEAISKVCRTSTHLFQFVANIQLLRGWSRGLRKGVSRFYTSRSVEQVAYQMVKYRNRAGFTHKDVLRLAHPEATSPEMNKLFGYAVGKVQGQDLGLDLIDGYELAQLAPNEETLAQLVSEYGLTHEMIPNEMLNKPKVLTALLDNMPTVALVRNLNRFAYTGLTDGNTNVTKKIVAKLSDKEAVKKSGIHPINVVNAMRTYASGHGDKGGKSWSPNQRIVDALNDMYQLALESLVPSGKNILIGVDVSGSMQTDVAGMRLNASQVANVLAVTMLKTEPNADMIWFDTRIQTSKLGRRNSIDEVLRQSPCGGGTDCALPILHAIENANKTVYDAIIIFTDNETWAGSVHGFDAIKVYRKINPNVKVIEVALAANPYTQLPVDDKNVLRVVGFDASVTEVINAYLK